MTTVLSKFMTQPQEVILLPVLVISLHPLRRSFLTTIADADQSRKRMTRTARLTKKRPGIIWLKRMTHQYSQ